ncbi:HU family DNA-binding protein [Candidatus Phytoplasma sacchari]
MAKKSIKKENNKITQSELINKIAKQARYSSKDVHNILQAFKENLFKTFSQGKGFSLSPIGTFKIAEMPARKGLDMNLLRTSKKKKIINFPAYQTVKFSFSDNFRKAIKKALN